MPWASWAQRRKFQEFIASGRLLQRTFDLHEEGTDWDNLPERAERKEPPRRRRKRDPFKKRKVK